MSTRRLRDRIVARRNYRAFERALEKAHRYGGAADLQAQYRRLLADRTRASAQRPPHCDGHGDL
jgi:hypothetical protein